MNLFITLQQSASSSNLRLFAFLCLVFLNLQPASAAIIYSDDFETGLGNWTNTNINDSNDWQRQSGGTTSRNTGPSSGSNTSRFFVYLETSYGFAFNNGDSAILESPILSGSSFNIAFDYHMHGTNIGSLSIDALVNGVWENDVWNVKGQQHSSSSEDFSNVKVDLSAYPLTQIRFRATAIGSYLGDIALDNIVITDSPTGQVPPEFNDAEFTKPLARENHAYLNSIKTDAIDANDDAIIFSKISGPDWLTISTDGTLSGIPSDLDVGINNFAIEASDGFLTNSALLKIEVIDRYTPYTVTENNFEQGLGLWTNETTLDTHNWTRFSNATSSRNTGPSGGSNSTYYLYLETSSSQAGKPGDTAIFVSPKISDKSLTLSFDYHMYGTDIGTLAVDVLSNDIWVNDVWSASGQQQTSIFDAYDFATVDLTSYQVSQVRFRATAKGSYRGDIAIDNIVVTSVPDSGAKAPQFSSDSLSKKDAKANNEYMSSIADDASDDNGDTLTFKKISGPYWLQVGSDGSLSGLPFAEDVGTNSFVIEVSDGELLDTANLTIIVNENTDGSLISFTDFENDFGDWANTSYDDDSWNRETGLTQSTQTGPSNGADGSKYYAYVETSRGFAYKVGDSVILESKPILNSSNLKLKFMYHMYGTDVGDLSIDVFDGSAWVKDVFAIRAPQQGSSDSPFQKQTVDLGYWFVEKIRIRVTTAGGYRGDIAIDNLEIYGNGTIDPGATTPTASKIAFVTSQGFNGKLGGLVGADNKCQAEANAANLTGTFKAFLSDNQSSAANRLNKSSIPYETVTGVKIADNWADLTDRIIDNPLNVTATGTISSGFAWTGSDYDGTKATYNPLSYPYNYRLDLTCSNWKSGGGFRVLGARGSIDDPRAWADWWQNDGSSCGNLLGLYCLEQ